MGNNNRSSDQLDNKWHLDKRVPLSIIIAILIQTVYFTVFITKLDSRVGVLEKDSANVHKVIKEMAEIRIHQMYISKDVQEISKFLRDDVDWITPKKRPK